MTNIRINGRLSAARYTVENPRRSHEADRLRIDGPYGEVWGLTISEALSLGRALIDLAVSGVARDVERSDLGGIH